MLCCEHLTHSIVLIQRCVCVQISQDIYTVDTPNSLYTTRVNAHPHASTLISVTSWHTGGSIRINSGWLALACWHTRFSSIRLLTWYREIPTYWITWSLCMWPAQNILICVLLKSRWYTAKAMRAESSWTVSNPPPEQDWNEHGSTHVLCMFGVNRSGLEASWIRIDPR